MYGKELRVYEKLQVNIGISFLLLRHFKMNMHILQFYALALWINIFNLLRAKNKQFIYRGRNSIVCIQRLTVQGP